MKFLNFIFSQPHFYIQIKFFNNGIFLNTKQMPRHTHIINKSYMMLHGILQKKLIDLTHEMVKRINIKCKM